MLREIAYFCSEKKCRVNWYECSHCQRLVARRKKKPMQDSCGCLIDRHGHYSGDTPTREMVSYTAMLGRCNNPNDPSYAHYGGRGISVCPAWCESFSAFLADMGPRPEGKTLDRIDVNGNYEPKNCRWATAKEQRQNMRSKHMITIDGVARPAAQWAKSLGIPKTTFYARLKSGRPLV